MNRREQFRKGAPKMTDTATAPNVACKLLRAAPHGPAIPPEHWDA